MPERRTRVLLADDHPMMLEGLRRLLEPDLDVVGVATNGRALLEDALLLRPDLVIADISMPGIDGIEVTRRLRETVPEAWILVLSVHTEDSWVRAAFAAGARAYVTKSSAPAEKAAFDAGAYGYLTKDSTPKSRPATGTALTPREMDILRLLGKGLANKEIAHELGVSVTTVRTHLSKIYEKVGPMSRVELALYAAIHGGSGEAREDERPSSRNQHLV